MKIHLLPVLAALTLGACKPAPAPDAVVTSSKPIRIGAYNWPGYYWMDIAQQKGWFEEAGLNVERVDTNGDFFGSFDDLVNGKLDFVQFATFDFVLYNAQGKDLVAVMCSDYSAGGEALVARAGIESVPDLAGKTIALSKGSYLDFLFSALAQRYEIDPASVTIVDVPGEKAADEYVAGRADAFLTWEPHVAEGLAKGKGRKLFTTAEALGNASNVGTLRREFLEQRSADVQALLGVWNRTTEFIKSQPEEAFAIVAAVNKKTPAAVKELTKIDKVLDLRENRTAFTYAAGPASLHAAIRQMSEFVVRRGLATRKVDSAEVLDDRFLRALEARP